MTNETLEYEGENPQTALIKDPLAKSFAVNN